MAAGRSKEIASATSRAAAPSEKIRRIHHEGITSVPALSKPPVPNQLKNMLMTKRIDAPAAA